MEDGYSGARVSQRLLRSVRAIVESAETLLREPTGDNDLPQRITFSNEEALAALEKIQVPSFFSSVLPMKPSVTLPLPSVPTIRRSSSSLDMHGRSTIDATTRR